MSADGRFDAIAVALAGLLDAPLVAISVRDGDGQHLVGSHGVSEADLAGMRPLLLEVVLLGRPVLLQDARRRLAAAHHAWSLPFVSYLGVPIAMHDGVTIGAVSVLSHRCNWQERDLDAARAIAAVAADAMARDQACEERCRRLEEALRTAREELAAAALPASRTSTGLEVASRAHHHHQRTLEIEELVLRDELTGLLNRRGFFVTGEPLFAAASAGRRPVWIVSLSVDAEQDSLLRATADVLVRTFESSDTIARLGDDQFAIAVTDAAGRDISTVTLGISTQLEHVGVRATMVGLVPSESRTSSTLSALMVEADRRLHLAKHPSPGM
jgi:GGDEF domain-containing protein